MYTYPPPQGDKKPLAALNPFSPSLFSGDISPFTPSLLVSMMAVRPWFPFENDPPENSRTFFPSFSSAVYFQLQTSLWRY